jgi:hypothetical protein
MKTNSIKVKEYQFVKVKEYFFNKLIKKLAFKIKGLKVIFRFSIFFIIY